jgi:hypothetical protein
MMPYAASGQGAVQHCRKILAARYPRWWRELRVATEGAGARLLGSQRFSRFSEVSGGLEVLRS